MKIQNKKKLREFGYLLGLCFPLIIGLLIPLISGESFRFWTLYLGIALFLIAYFYPQKLNFIYKFWMRLGEILGWINSRFILGIIFIFILQPIAFLMRLFNYDPLSLKKKNLQTYRKNREDFDIDFTRIF